MLPSRADWSPFAAFRALTLTLLATLLVWPGTARAAVERRVESSTTTLEVAADGRAIVRHELVLSVRGAPLVSFTLRGVDSDAEPLPDATVTRLAGGSGPATPQPVTVHASAGQLDVNVARQGLRGSSFLLKLAYRTRLEGALRALGEAGRAELEWLGPRFDDGVDSVTLILQLPAGRSAPEVAPPRDADESYGIIMSTLRRSRDRDELELVRAHVARDEAMHWIVRLDAGVLASPPQGASVSPDPELPPAVPAAPRPDGATRELLGVLGAGALYALLVWLKTSGLAAAARARDASARAWLPGSGALRAFAAGVALASAAVLALSGKPPLAAAAALLLAMAFAAHRSAEEKPRLHGPGEWRPLESSAFTLVPTPALPGAWLDAGRARGFVLLLACLGGVVYAAQRAFESSPFSGACLLLGGSALLPVFCTGRAAELPLDALNHSRRFLSDVAQRLSRQVELVVKPIGRVAAQSDELDELRLSITPARAVPGLLGVELGLELRERLGGYAARPVVVVRASEGSECQRALPRGLTWTRGRNEGERATLVRPKLPSAELSAALLQELFALLASPPARAEAPVKNASKSAGKGLSTAKAGTLASPAHAT